MSRQVRISDETFKNLKGYCDTGEKPQMMAVIGLAVAEYLERKNRKDERDLESAIKMGAIKSLPQQVGPGLSPVLSPVEEG